MVVVPDDYFAKSYLKCFLHFPICFSTPEFESAKIRKQNINHWETTTHVYSSKWLSAVTCDLLIRRLASRGSRSNPTEADVIGFHHFMFDFCQNATVPKILMRWYIAANDSHHVLIDLSFSSGSSGNESTPLFKCPFSVEITAWKCVYDVNIGLSMCFWMFPKKSVVAC